MKVMNNDTNFLQTMGTGNTLKEGGKNEVQKCLVRRVGYCQQSSKALNYSGLVMQQVLDSVELE